MSEIVKKLDKAIDEVRAIGLDCETELWEVLDAIENQQPTIESLRAEVEQLTEENAEYQGENAALRRLRKELSAEIRELRGLIEAAIKGYDFDCYCKKSSMCCHRIGALMSGYRPEAANDTPD